MNKHRENSGIEERICVSVGTGRALARKKFGRKNKKINIFSALKEFFFPHGERWGRRYVSCGVRILVRILKTSKICLM